MRTARDKPENSALLWDDLASLPIATDIDAASDFSDLPNAEFRPDGINASRYGRSEWGIVEIWRSTGTGDSVITADLTLWGWADGRAWLLEILSASAVTVNDRRGISFKVRHVGGYEKLALTAGAASPTAGSISAKYTPLLEG